MWHYNLHRSEFVNVAAYEASTTEPLGSVLRFDEKTSATFFN
ncbi:hypothetical protein LMG23992_02260 [Cupriavidus laharis]|uniref:Uncharacterized protein n=1 Tax=Cupriavidus laharis TaxID=151654 RepID=A0ABN7YGJ3_9BURK|nr:hypothetical protein LMG23992_02260 [Cupriavidus laharis]